MKEILENSGFDVTQSGEGQDAIDRLSEDVFDFIVSEVRMPNINGIELMEEVIMRRIRARVVFVTAYGEVESYMDLMNMGALDYFNKPVRQQEIIRTLEKAMEAQSIAGS